MNKRFVRLMFLMAFSSFSLCAQFNVGVQGSYINVFNSSHFGQFGFGIRGEMAANEIFVGQAGFNYYFPRNYTDNLKATAKSFLTVPSTLPVQGISRLTLSDYYIGVKYYLLGTHTTFKKESGTGIYVAGDIGVLVGGFETKGIETNSIDWELYNVPLKDTQLGAFTFLSLNPSIGAERRFHDRLYAYAEFKLFVKLLETSENGVIEFDVPAAFNFNLGVRIPLGSEY